MIPACCTRMKYCEFARLSCWYTVQTQCYVRRLHLVAWLINIRLGTNVNSVPSEHSCCWWTKDYVKGDVASRMVQSRYDRRGRDTTAASLIAETTARLLTFQNLIWPPPPSYRPHSTTPTSISSRWSSRWIACVGVVVVECGHIVTQE